jgi:hypothetical protein
VQITIFEGGREINIGFGGRLSGLLPFEQQVMDDFDKSVARFWDAGNKRLE